MDIKTNAVVAGKTPCEKCGSPSTTAGAGGKALCSSCASLVKKGAYVEPSFREVTDTMVEHLTRE